MNFCLGGKICVQKIFCWHTPLFSHHTLSTKIFLLEPTQEYFLKDFEYYSSGSVERSFSAMKLIKTRLCSGITEPTHENFRKGSSTASSLF